MHSVVDRKLGNFQFPAFTNKMAMVMIEQISLWKDDVSTGNKPKCDIGRSISNESVAKYLKIFYISHAIKIIVGSSNNDSFSFF